MRFDQTALDQLFPSAEPSWREQQLFNFAPKVLQALCKTVPLITDLRFEKVCCDSISVYIESSASLKEANVRKIADITAAASGQRVNVHYRGVGANTKSGNISSIAPGWRLTPPREFCDSIQSFDPREIDLSAAALFNCIDINKDNASIEAWLDTQQESLRSIEQFHSIEFDQDTKTIRLNLDLITEDLLNLDNFKIFEEIAQKLPADYNLTVCPLQYEEITRIEPRLPADLSNPELKHQVLNSLRNALSTRLIAFEANHHAEGFEVHIPLSTLPANAIKKLELLLAQYGVPVILYDTPIAARTVTPEDLPSIVNFFLPDEIFFHHAERKSDILILNVRRYRNTSIKNDLPEMLGRALQTPVTVVSEVFNSQLEDALRRNGREMQAILAQISDSDGVIRKDYESLSAIVKNTLFKTDKIDIVIPTEQQLEHFPRMSEQFVALGILNSLHEDAFHIERTLDGFKLDVALIDGSVFVPPELGIYSDLQNCFASAYAERERFDLLPREQIEKHAGYKIGEYRPSVVVTFYVMADGSMYAPPTVKLASVSIAAEFDRSNFTQAVNNGDNSIEIQCQLFDRLTLVLKEKRLSSGGLVWRTSAGEVFETQFLVNQFLSEYAAKNYVPYLYRVLDTPTVEERKSYADDIFVQFGGYFSEVKADLSPSELDNDRKFRRYLQSVSTRMSNREIKELCSLLRNRHYFDVDPDKTDFFQLGKRYSQSSGSLRYFPALINIGQISRYLRRMPLYDRNYLERFATDSTLIQRDSLLLGRLLTSQTFVGSETPADITQDGRKARLHAAPDLRVGIETSERINRNAALNSEPTKVEVIGYSLIKNRTIARLTRTEPALAANH